MSQESTLEPMARTLSYRLKLNAEDRAAILRLPHHVRTIQRGHFMVRERETTTHSCLMLSGISARSKIVGSGHRQIVAVHMQGDMVDLQNSLLEVADHSVEALTTSKVAMIPREEIIRLAEERPQVGRALWLDTLVEGSISREWVANIGRRDARTRILHVLCEFAVRLRVAGLAEEDQYELPMTQEQLADATGLTSGARQPNDQGTGIRTADRETASTGHPLQRLACDGRGGRLRHQLFASAPLRARSRVNGRHVTPEC